MSVESIAFYMHDLSGGGVERMRLVLIAQLRQRGMDVRLVVARLRGPLIALLPSDLPVEELGSSHMLSAVLPLARYLERTCPDVLVASLDHNNITALLARLIAPVRTSVVICQHNCLSAERAIGWRYRIVPWLYWALQRRARAIIAVSNGVADDLAKTAHVARKRITTVYNPVVGRDFKERTSGPPPHAWLTANRMCPVFISAGRLTAQKDPGTLIDSMALLLTTRSARLIVLGEGPLQADIEAQTAKLGIADRVAFVGFQSNPLPWIKHGDVLISTSRYEGLGNSIIEALACGTPVIATDCPHGPSEILLGGKIGRLVPVGDVDALARAMTAEIDEPASRFVLTSRAASFTAEACANAHMALFEQWSLIAPPPHVIALGLNFSPLRADQILERITADTHYGEVRLVVTPNIEHIRLLRDRAFAAAYNSAHFICPDGFPVLLYARLRGLRLSARVTGCELFHLLANHTSLPRKKLCIVAESDSTASAVTKWATAVGFAADATILVAAIGLDDNTTAQVQLATEIRAAAPDILIMTLGAPRSEVFVDQYRHLLRPCWALCVGQAVRVELGLTKRAPNIWRVLGLEWLWRIKQEPRRMVSRYAKALAWFPVAILKDLHPAWRLRSVWGRSMIIIGLKTPD